MGSQVGKWWDTFHYDGRVEEVRIIGGGRTYSGYFRDWGELDGVIERFDGVEGLQCYFVLNRIKGGCYSRVQSGSMVERPKETTGDGDIERREWVLIDLDPIRISGVCSTDIELGYAYTRCREIYRYLEGMGFGRMVVARSGNGYHILIRCDIGVSNDETALIRDFLRVLNIMFGDGLVEVDEKVFNLSRISKLYGTMAKKGSNSEERPHRRSEIVYDKGGNVSGVDLFRRVVSSIDLGVKGVGGYSSSSSSSSGYDVKAFLERNGIKYRESSIRGGVKYVLEHCVFDENHKGSDAAIIKLDGGGISYVCFHNSCSSYTWRDVRLKYEPDAYREERKTDRQRVGVRDSYNNRRAIIGESVELGKKWLQLSDIHKVDLNVLPYIKTGFNELDNRIMGLYLGETTILSGSNSCVSYDTEFFNGVTWKKIGEWEQGDRVLQYNVDGSVSLVVPSRYIVGKCESLYRLRSKLGFEQVVSDNHDLVFSGVNGLEKVEAKSFIDGGCVYGGEAITCFSGTYGVGSGISGDLLMLSFALLLRGRGKGSGYKTIRCGSKEQYCFIVSLCNKSGIKYDTDGYSKVGVYLEDAPISWFYACNVEEYRLLYKVFDVLCMRFTKSRIKVYYSIRSEVVDLCQWMLSMVGVRSVVYCDKRGGTYDGSGHYHRTDLYSVRVYTRSSGVDVRFGVSVEEQEHRYKYCFSVPSGMLVLRCNGRINVTGNSGKSSWLNSLLLNAVDGGYKAALWSGELRPDILKTWIQMVAAGARNLRKSQFSDRYYVPNVVGEQIDRWLDGKLYIYNNSYSQRWEQIFNDMKELLEVGCNLFVLDNLFSLDIDIFDGDRNNKQKELIIEVCKFAKEKNVHIILVAHPRKTTAFLRKNDISGTGDLANAVDNILICHRVSNDFLKMGGEFLGAAAMGELQRYGNVIEVAKNRLYGVVDYMVGMQFETQSRRFLNEITEDKRYGWELLGSQEELDSNICVASSDRGDISQDNNEVVDLYSFPY